MPVVQVFTWASQTLENKEKMIKDITQVFVDLGTPASAVTIIIVNGPKDSWGREGKVETSN